MAALHSARLPNTSCCVMLRQWCAFNSSFFKGRPRALRGQIHWVPRSALHYKVGFIKAVNPTFAKARGRSEASGSSPDIQKAATIKNAFVGLLHQVQAPTTIPMGTTAMFGENTLCLHRPWRPRACPLRPHGRGTEGARSTSATSAAARAGRRHWSHQRTRTTSRHCLRRPHSQSHRG